MKITKTYNRNVNLGNYQTARIGLSLEKEIDDKMSKKELAVISNKLLDVCKDIVKEELETLKEEEAQR